jgi:hypothetical protein
MGAAASTHPNVFWDSFTFFTDEQEGRKKERNERSMTNLWVHS